MAALRTKVTKATKSAVKQSSTAKERTSLPTTTGPKATKPPLFPLDAHNRRYWLIKSEPYTRLDPKTGIDAKFSILDLCIDGGETGEPWDGVRNYEAKNNLINMKKDDVCLFYHSNCKAPGIVGIAKVTSEQAIPDAKQFDKKSNYFDPKATLEKPIWWCPLISFVCILKRKISLQELKESGQFSELFLLKRGRLSVNPVSAKHFNMLMELQNKGEISATNLNEEFDCDISQLTKFDSKLLD